MPESEYTRSSSTTSTDLFGKYEIGKLLGCGAFAKVYQARNVSTGQSVAIKAVSKQKVLDGGFAAYVKREISIMRRMRHPNIVRLDEVLATKTKVYLVMEYARGGELFARLARGRFSEDLSRRYFQQLISVVGYCHSRGVFHRDLKPENLLLDDKYNLKVTDFGLSAVTGTTRPDGLLHTVCGSPAYVAPEVLAKKGYDGAKVDVWSCGVVLFFLHAGYLPFNDPNLMVLYHRIYKGEFQFPKWTSPDLRRFLRRMLDPNPETRITVDEIIHDPWFKKGCYKEIKHNVVEDYYIESKEELQAKNKCLNAFDLISFSSGFDLSGLFDVADEVSVERHRFISAEKPDSIIERIEEEARRITEEVNVKKRRENGIRLEGCNGNFVIAVDIQMLTEKLAVVEVGTTSDEIWKVKLWPKLSDLVYKNEES